MTKQAASLGCVMSAGENVTDFKNMATIPDGAGDGFELQGIRYVDAM